MDVSLSSFQQISLQPFFFFFFEHANGLVLQKLKHPFSRTTTDACGWIKNQRERERERERERDE